MDGNGNIVVDDRAIEGNNLKWYWLFLLGFLSSGSYGIVLYFIGAKKWGWKWMSPYIKEDIEWTKFYLKRKLK